MVVRKTVTCNDRLISTNANNVVKMQKIAWTCLHHSPSHPFSNDLAEQAFWKVHRSTRVELRIVTYLDTSADRATSVLQDVLQTFTAGSRLVRNAALNEFAVSSRWDLATDKDVRASDDSLRVWPDGCVRVSI